MITSFYIRCSSIGSLGRIRYDEAGLHDSLIASVRRVDPHAMQYWSYLELS